MSILTRRFNGEFISRPYRREEDPHRTEMVASTQEVTNVGALFSAGYERAFDLSVHFHNRFYVSERDIRGVALAKETAETEMLHFIYGPVLAKLAAMRSAASNRDYKDVVALTYELEKELTG